MIQYSTIQYNTIQYDTIQCGTVRYGTVRCGTVRYGAVRYGTVRYGFTRSFEYKNIDAKLICLKKKTNSGTQLKVHLFIFRKELGLNSDSTF